MPDISGMEFLAVIRGQPAYGEIPVLVLSALVDPDQIRDALNGGADRPILTKPYIATISAVVQEMLRRGGGSAHRRRSAGRCRRASP
ncbi:MAG: hypothetical protein IPK17_35840 [Chloroflexi bacterium]|uniref:hypothetical protein n=1 Tax=Candidatus Flexifilum breve TaxID=3140694 RepID=UPI0031373F19|nr:hypothetical protein [Chloroflexota bacterium]